MKKYIEWFESLKIHPETPLEKALHILYRYAKMCSRRNSSYLQPQVDEEYVLIKVTFMYLDGLRIGGLLPWQTEIVGICEAAAKKLMAGNNISSESICYRYLYEPFRTGTFDMEAMPPIFDAITEAAQERVETVGMSMH